MSKNSADDTPARGRQTQHSEPPAVATSRVAGSQTTFAHRRPGIVRAAGYVPRIGPLEHREATLRSRRFGLGRGGRDGQGAQRKTSAGTMEDEQPQGARGDARGQIDATQELDAAGLESSPVSRQVEPERPRQGGPRLAGLVERIGVHLDDHRRAGGRREQRGADQVGHHQDRRSRFRRSDGTGQKGRLEVPGFLTARSRAADRASRPPRSTARTDSRGADRRRADGSEREQLAAAAAMETKRRQGLSHHGGLSGRGSVAAGSAGVVSTSPTSRSSAWVESSPATSSSSDTATRWGPPRICRLTPQAALLPRAACISSLAIRMGQRWREISEILPRSSRTMTKTETCA